jgi:hypothetical protein
MSSIHLRLGLPSGLFPSGFPTNSDTNTQNKHDLALEILERLTVNLVNSGLFVADGNAFEEWCLLGCYAVWLL